MSVKINQEKITEGDLKYWIWYSRIEEIGTKKLLKLLELYKTPENIFKLDKKELMKNNFLTENMVEDILNEKYRKHLEKYEQYMKLHEIETIPINNKKYPEKLLEIYDPPIVLYAKGNIELLNKESIGIVGCRKCSEYGKRVAIDFSYELAKRNIVVISGMARGIDTYSHIGCLKGNGKTIAVVGCGLDMVYPPENKKVFEEIINNNGLILSEYVIGTKPYPKNFPKRNRIISGLSNGIVVVEAREKSGTLITVDFALEQGKDVCVVPGNIYSTNSIGTNDLIKQGATLITRIEDILEDF